ncbi:MAG: hypothetical protein H7210_00975 [Pyrinomonadaceae bacterium]|nr:hypothetical protein [Phycisphaerales bacterium]
MKRFRSFFRLMMVSVVAAATLFAGSQSFAADKLHLKDGKVLEGSIVAEGKGWVQFTYSIAGIEQTRMFLDNEYKQVEKDATVKSVVATDKNAGVAASSEKKPGVTRVAILNFGPPSDWSEQCGNMVGVEISAEAYKNAIPMLKKQNVDVVVIRVNSGGGYTLEMERFQDLFHNEYKKNFRTVAWIESAISAAAMSPWVIEEFYFMKKGNMGACTEWSGALQASKDVRLAMILHKMEVASSKGGHNPFIMRAMQIQQGLSVTKDPVTGKITWFDNTTSGKKIINPDNGVLTINSIDAVEYGLARAIADNTQELCRAMLGENAEYEIIAQDVSAYVDNFMREQTKAEKTAVEVAIKYTRAVALAQAVQDKQERGAQVNIAKKQLAQLRKWVKMNPNMEFHLANQIGALLDEEWFRIQEEMLRDLLK